MLVDIHSGHDLKVTFAYDPRKVQLVKTVPGKRWVPAQKHWTIPAAGLRALQQEAARAGVDVRVTGAVTDALESSGRRREELRKVKLDVTSLDLPTDTEPYPYQYSGIRFLKMALHNFKGVLCADDMGLGKTFMALSIVVMHDGVRNVLVLAPATLKYTWASEIERHYSQLTYTVIDGGPDKRVAQWEEDTRIKICNYELLLRDVYPRVTQWDLVIGDEVTRLKNYRLTGLRTAKDEDGKLVRDGEGNLVKEKYITIVGRVKALNRIYTIGLSGAPVENRLEELWSIMDFCIPGVLGNGWVFFKQHVVTDKWGGLLRYQGIDQVKERVEPYYIRRRKREVLTELPDKVYSEVKIELSDAEWKFYGAIQGQIRDEIEDNPKLNVGSILTMMLRLKQAVDDPRLLDEKKVASTKVATIKEILEGAAGEHRVVFFTQFSTLADLLGEELEAPVIAGHVSAKERQLIVDQFQAGEYPCLVSTDAGAYGITLTAADIVVHIDLPWNPARMRQREDRLHRIGQKNSVQVVSLIAQRTIDEYVKKIIYRKGELIQQILDDEIPDSESVKLDRGELMALLGAEDVEL
jgi:SNF2 family DNA or RNA helicase